MVKMEIAESSTEFAANHIPPNGRADQQAFKIWRVGFPWNLVPDPSEVAWSFIFRLSLPNKYLCKMICAHDSGPRYRARASPRSIRHHALECNSFLRQFRHERGKGARRVGRALPDLLASDFFIRMPARSFRAGRAGSYPGFFSYGA